MTSLNVAILPRDWTSDVVNPEAQTHVSSLHIKAACDVLTSVRIRIIVTVTLVTMETNETESGHSSRDNRKDIYSYETQ